MFPFPSVASNIPTPIYRSIVVLYILSTVQYFPKKKMNKETRSGKKNLKYLYYHTTTVRVREKERVI